MAFTSVHGGHGLTFNVLAMISAPWSSLVDPIPHALVTWEVTKLDFVRAAKANEIGTLFAIPSIAARICEQCWLSDRPQFEFLSSALSLQKKMRAKCPNLVWKIFAQIMQVPK